MNCTLSTKRLAAVALTSLALAAAPAAAAPVWIQDYEPPGNLDSPFNLQPDFSGSTVGVNGATDNIVHVNNDGAVGSTGSAEVTIPHLASESPTAAGWQWQVRFLPNNGGNNTFPNSLFAADGYVGFYLKVSPNVTADMQVSPVLEGPAGTTEATSGLLKTVIKDDRWHVYQWNMDNPADFPGDFTAVYSGGLGNTTLEATNSFDSIAIVSTNGGDAVIRIDQIGYDAAGPLVPEPTTTALAAMVALTLAAARRRG
jgi:hypothetical protein